MRVNTDSLLAKTLLLYETYSQRQVIIFQDTSGMLPEVFTYYIFSISIAVSQNSPFTK